VGYFLELSGFIRSQAFTFDNQIAAMSENIAPIAAKSPVHPFAAIWREPGQVLLEERTDVTVDELERSSLPHPAELYDGRVVYKMPNYAHGVIHSNLTYALQSYLKGQPVGLISIDANFRLWPNRPRDSRAPDLSFITKERLPQDLTRFLPIAPDLAVEILSPDDVFARVMEKVEAYLQQGAQIVWIVIPDTREVLVCTSQGKYSVRDLLTAPELLPGFELSVSEIFAGLETKTLRFPNLMYASPICCAFSPQVFFK
jgi:Uma2 family endonuclease